MLEQLYTHYNNHQEKIAKLEQSIARQQQRLSKLRNKSNWYDQIIVPLATELSKELMLPCEILGPFGLGCETHIYFFATGRKRDILRSDTYGITLHPHFGDDRFYLTYNTGEKTNEYPEGTIGYLNGFNNVEAELPDDIEKIIEIIKHNFCAAWKEE